MKTLVVGLGNPLLGDDGVGWRVAEQVRLETNHFPEPVDVECLSVGGLGLMERLVGYDYVVLIDAINSGSQPAGTVTCFDLEDLPDRTSGHTASSHDTSLQNALKLGRAMGAHLPERLWVVGIEAQFIGEFSEELTPEVESAIPVAVQEVLKILRNQNKEERP